MTDIVEIHWNARSELANLRIKVGGGSLDPRAERLFDEVREGAATLFPGCVTLVRIATRDKDQNARLRICRAGVEQEDLTAVEALINRAVQRIEHAENERCG